MRSLHNGLATMMTAGALLIFPATNTHLTRTISRAPADPKTAYAPSQKEFYMTADEFGYIRPGFKITVNSITIPEDRRPLVDLSFTDDFNQPLDRLGQVTPGVLSISQVLAWWNPDTRYYTAYTTRVQTSPITNVAATQASSDSAGAAGWTDLDLGHSTYKFKTVLPADYDVTKTHTLAIYATRNLTDIVGKNYYDNVEYDFRPDAQPVTATWDKTADGDLQQVSRHPRPARGLPPGRQALRHVPQPADDRSGHRQHGGHEGHGPQDPPGRVPAERRGRDALPDHRKPAVGP